MKKILMMSVILYVSIGYSQDIILEHTLEGRKDVFPIGDIDGDGIPELMAEIDQDYPSHDLQEIYDGATLELKWVLPSYLSNSGIMFTAIKNILSPFFDFNGDGNLDYLTTVGTYDNTTGFIIYDIINSSTIYEYDFPEIGSNRHGEVFLADIDGDSEVEIISPFEYDDGSGNEISTSYFFSTGVSLGVNQQISIPDNYKLFQNYPNPFNPTTTIQYEMPQNGNVNVSIYNIKGELVEELVDGYKNRGKYSIQWNPKNVSSGQYFYQISVDGFVQTRKMVLLK
jgi:hypothetical protein|tara:strand:- start:12 stop:860 length:849 start_codon:yes stop_codon:yes gene_type:complete